jgi:hypothetical protein
MVLPFFALHFSPALTDPLLGTTADGGIVFPNGKRTNPSNRQPMFANIDATFSAYELRQIINLYPIRWQKNEGRRIGCWAYSPAFILLPVPSPSGSKKRKERPLVPDDRFVGFEIGIASSGVYLGCQKMGGEK